MFLYLGENMTEPITDEDVHRYAVSLGRAPAQLLPRRAVLEVRCPQCHAAPGAPCMSRAGARKSNHLDRVFDRVKILLANKSS